MAEMGWIKVFVIGDGWTLTIDAWDIAKIDYIKQVIARKAKIPRKGMRMMTVGGRVWPVRHAPRWSKAADCKSCCCRHSPWQVAVRSSLVAMKPPAAWPATKS